MSTPTTSPTGTIQVVHQQGAVMNVSDFVL
jgi:hypothetical protein